MTTYIKTNWIDDNTAITAELLNKREQGTYDLHQEIIVFNMAGIIAAFAGTSAPAGWLKCNGSGVSKTTYPALFSAIGYTHGGSGDTFNLPDIRGVFVRVLDEGKGYDAGRTFGSYQADENKQHNHPFTDYYKNGNYNDNPNWGGPNAVGNHDAQQTSGSSGGEGRPINMALIYYIKY